MEGTSNIVDLNVGGTHYTTSLATLTRFPGTYFAARFSGRYDPSTEMDSSNRVFVDRDGLTFRYILNFLRTGTLVIPENDLILHQQVLQEADFFAVEPLAKLCRKRLATIKQHSAFKRPVVTVARPDSPARQASSPTNDDGSLQRFSSSSVAPKRSAPKLPPKSTVQLDFDDEDF